MKGNSQVCQNWLRHSALTALKYAGWIPATVYGWFSIFLTGLVSWPGDRNGWEKAGSDRPHTSFILLLRRGLIYVTLQLKKQQQLENTYWR